MTKERILNEAEALFAMKGFHAVSVREITTAASCNLAAVNYHFGNKDSLYLEVFRCRWLPRAKLLQKAFKDNLAGNDSPTPAQVVEALAQAFLNGPMSDEERQRHHMLITKELSQPTPALKLVVQEAMAPLISCLMEKLRAGMPEDCDDQSICLNILSIFAQVLYFNFARDAVTRITGHTYDDAFKTRLVNHITQFSQSALGDGI
jgi:AcrR family transcriptional regulator